MQQRQGRQASPIVLELRRVTRQARLAPEIERAAARHRKARKLDEAVAVIDAADPNNLTPRQRENVVRAASIIAARLGVGTTARAHRAVDPHDYVAPDVREVSLVFGMERCLKLLREWADDDDLDDVVAPRVSTTLVSMSSFQPNLAGCSASDTRRTSTCSSPESGST